MEVHHHPNVEKKRFKEYFLEFLIKENLPFGNLPFSNLPFGNLPLGKFILTYYI